MLWVCLSRISKFPKEIKLKRYLHEMTDVVVAGTKVDAAGEERSPSEQEEAVVKQGKTGLTRQTGYK